VIKNDALSTEATVPLPSSSLSSKFDFKRSEIFANQRLIMGTGFKGSEVRAIARPSSHIICFP